MPIIKLGPNAIRKTVSGGGQNFMLPNELLQATYGPGWPINPMSPPRDTEMPRSIDYPLSANATITPRTIYGLMSFPELYEAYNNVAEVSTPISLISRELTTFTPKWVDDEDNEIPDFDLQWLVNKPDRKTPWTVWLTRLMQSTKIYDAPAVHVSQSNGKLDGLRVIDGSTLFLIINEYGELPEPESIEQYKQRRQYEEYTHTAPQSSYFGDDFKTEGVPTNLSDFIAQLEQRKNKGLPVPTKVPAFTQIIKGTPFSWWSKDQIWYQPQNPSIGNPYGQPFIEKSWGWIMIIVNITAFQLGFYRQGTVPEAFLVLPRDFYPKADSLLLAEQMMNFRMTSNPATERNRIRTVPEGTQYIPTKDHVFPMDLYSQAWKNVLHSIGIPPSEFGDVPGQGLGGKGFKEGATSDLSRNTLNPHREFVMSMVNDIAEKSGVNIKETRFELAYPTEEIDPDKLKEAAYDGLAHAAYTVNDVLGQLGMNPVVGSVDAQGNPIDNHIANKHMIIAGQSIYILEDMKTDPTGMAVPDFGKPNANHPADIETVAEQAGAEHTPQDHKTISDILRNMEALGKISNTTYSIPTTQFKTTLFVPEGMNKRYEVRGTTVYNIDTGKPVPGGEHDTKEQANNHMAALYANVPDVQKTNDNNTAFEIGFAEEQQEHPQLASDLIAQLVMDHLKRNPHYYDETSVNKFIKVNIDKHDGCMIAVFIPNPVAGQLRKITENLGLPSDAELELPENYHVTLAFLPDSNKAVADKYLLFSVMQGTALDHKSIIGNIQGYGVFNGQDGKHVLFAMLDCPELPAIRQQVIDGLKTKDIEYSKDHGFVPHITLAYFPDDWQLPEGFMIPDMPVEIDGVSLAIGEDITTITFQDGYTRFGKILPNYSVGTGLQKYQGKLDKHCGVCPEDDMYFGAPITREIEIDFLPGAHANGVEIVAMTPNHLPPKPALWKPEGDELTGLQEMIGGKQFPREEAVYLIDRSLGFRLVPLSYVSISEQGEHGAVVYYTFGITKSARRPEEYADYWTARAAVLDYIISQQDRGFHHNYGTHPDDITRMILFDNGLSLPIYENRYCVSPFCDLWANKPLPEDVIVAIKILLNDSATWKDVLGLVGEAAVNKARYCAERLIAEGMITSYDTKPMTPASYPAANESETL